MGEWADGWGRLVWLAGLRGFSAGISMGLEWEFEGISWDFQLGFKMNMRGISWI